MTKGKRARKKSSSGIPSPYLVMGRNTLATVLEQCPKRMKRIYLSDRFASQEDLGRALSKFAEKNKVSLQILPNEELSDLVGSESHQSCVAELLPPRVWQLDELTVSSGDDKRSWILMIDGVQDPQNFGTLLRVAECFSACGVVWSANRSAPLSPVVTKAAVGASEILRLCPLSNLADAMRSIREAGYWLVGTSLEARSEALPSFDFPEKTALILGSEGKGMSRLVAELCDFLIKIPISGSLQSLNVSQAAAIVAYAFEAQNVDLKQ